MTNSFYGGLGLRPAHYPHVLSQRPKAPRFFEVISENFMDSQGRPREVLHQVRQDYEVFLHGVSLSIASVETLDWNYLKNLKILIDEIEPKIVSDHLCWNRNSQHSLHDLLPFPYTAEALQWIEGKVHQVQDYLGRPLLLENLSYYVTSLDSEMSEAQFLNELCRRTGCQVLFDLNNLYINSQNFSQNPYQYIVDLGLQNVGQLHLAGHTREEKFLFDTHSQVIAEPVLQLYQDIASLLKNTPVMVEWDAEIPEFGVLHAELERVRKAYEQGIETLQLPELPTANEVQL